MKEEFDDFDNHSISKFESMLKTNSFLFFDSNEYEEIIIYYIETGNIFLAKKGNITGFETISGLYHSFAIARRSFINE